MFRRPSFIRKNVKPEKNGTCLFLPEYVDFITSHSCPVRVPKTKFDNRVYTASKLGLCLWRVATLVYAVVERFSQWSTIVMHDRSRTSVQCSSRSEWESTPGSPGCVRRHARATDPPLWEIVADHFLGQWVGWNEEGVAAPKQGASKDHSVCNLHNLVECACSRLAACCGSISVTFRLKKYIQILKKKKVGVSLNVLFPKGREIMLTRIKRLHLQIQGLFQVKKLRPCDMLSFDLSILSSISFFFLYSQVHTREAKSPSIL